MPQPLGLNKKLDFLEDWDDPTTRPDCATAMIGVIVAWTRLESQLASLFAIATGDIKAEEGGGWSGSENLVSGAALRAIDSLHTRFAVVNAVWERIRLPKELRTEFDTLSARIRRAAGWRNAVAHTRWVITKPFPNDVVDADEKKRYSAKDFQDMTERMEDLRRDVAMYGSKCVKHLLKHPLPRSGRHALQFRLQTK